MLYLCAAYSGLRAGTLAKLTVRNVELTTGRIHIPAGNMKAGRATLKPLHTVLRAELPAWLANRDPDSLLWPTRWLKKAARMLWRDLKDAGIPVQYKGHDGITRYRDFHALRHRLASELPKAGAGMKSAQSLLDHTDVRLTMNVYAHSDITTQASDLDLVPAPPSCQTQAKGLDPVALLASAYLLQQAILGAVLGMPTTPKQPEGN
jgi:integrase